MSVTSPATAAYRFTLRGRVQGIGLRPAVARLAAQLALSGEVRNAAAGVVIDVEGPEDRIDEFRTRLPSSLPAEAQVFEVQCTSSEPRGLNGFTIVASTTEGALSTRVPTDQATCDACLAEVAAHADPRLEYAFISCTDCGPRYSIIDAMPYDRCRTSMTAFPLCARCAAEFDSPDDRRFHAQTNACPACGPSLRVSPTSDRDSGDRDESPLSQAGHALRQGQIVALRGLGGYQLLVDATNESAVQRLRERKRRNAKPLAVMVQALRDAERLALLTDRERTLLVSPSRPIVLTQAKPTNGLTTGIHPGLNDMGLFLPTTALHWLLLEEVHRPLVVTSGNLEGDPLAADVEHAERELHGVADLWLHHDRDIVRPIDDSVVRVIARQPVTIRNARGLAPLPLDMTHVQRHTPQVLALGGHQKNAVALFNREQAVLGPHVGDLESLASREQWITHIGQLQQLYRCTPEVIVHDLHPDYFTTQWARSRGVPTIAVQHHHAHVVSAMLENGWLDREVLGVAFDGTGYGTDATIWGGEFLHATVSGFDRVAHLRPFRLPGGEAAVREPWRVAAALVTDSIDSQAAADVFSHIGSDTLQAVLQLTKNERLAPVTTSAGRLFDGVAALILGVTDAGFEGHAAMLLEATADRSSEKAYDFGLTETSPLQLDWRPMIRQLLTDRQTGCPVGSMATKFHRGLARGIMAVCRRYHLPVVLSGGVFQNRLLTELLLDELSGGDHSIGVHSAIPPNDGGLAAGQLSIAMARLAAKESATGNNIEGVR